jgi:hypothetical protein
MTEPATTVPAEGLLARFIGMFTAPKATFASVVAHPRPAGILFLVAFITAIGAALPYSTEAGRQAALDMQVQGMERFGMTVTPEMVTQMQKQQKFGAISGGIGAFVVTPLACLFFAGLYFVIFNAIMGGTATFKQVVSVVAHSKVIGAVGQVIGVPIMMMRGTISMFGPFNLGVLVPFLDENNFLARLLGSTSVFMIWGLLVLGIGLGVLYKRNGMKIGIVLNLVYFVIAAALTAVFGSLMSR